MKSSPRTHGVNLQGMNISKCTSDWTSAVELNCTSQGTPIELVDMAFWSNMNRAGAVHSKGCNVLVANSTFYNNTARIAGGGICVVRILDSWQYSPKMLIPIKTNHIACTSAKGTAGPDPCILTSSTDGRFKECCSVHALFYLIDVEEFHYAMLVNSHQYLFFALLKVFSIPLLHENEIVKHRCRAGVY